MIYFNDVKKEVIDSRFDGVELQYPKKEYGYYGYKAGTSKLFETLAEAQAFSLNVEKVQVNVETYNCAMKKYDEQATAIQEAYNCKLRGWFIELNDAEFNIIWSKAYDDGHAYGYDEVFIKMESLTELYMKLKKAQ